MEYKDYLNWFQNNISSSLNGPVQALADVKE